jgi:hypothetical protein
MIKSLTLNELLEKIADPNVPVTELAPYFQLAPGRAPYAFEVEFNEALVEDAVRRGQMAINIFNSYFALRRQRAYRAKLDAGWRGVRLLAEGDSWFEYPHPFGKHDDVVDCLTEFYAIYCVSAASDTLENMTARASELETLIAELNPDGFMFSAGGNDIAGPTLSNYLEDYEDGVDDGYLLTPAYGRFLDDVAQTYDGFLKTLTTRFPKLHIFCHGYDYALPQRGGRWLGPQFMARHFPEERWAPIVRKMIDDFNATLARLAPANGGRVHYIDCRGAIGGLTEWRDELHGRDAGCLRVAGRFRKTIDATFPELAQAGLAFNPRAEPPAPMSAAPPASRYEPPLVPTISRGMAAKGETEPFAVSRTDPDYVIIEMFGGDNNLDVYVQQDMAEMAAAAAQNVAVLAIADFRHAPASVIEVGADGPRIIEEWGEIDTGDPEVLTRFLARALITYPNARKCIGCWDHGTGPFDESDNSEKLDFRKMVSVSRGERSRSWPQRRLFFPKSRLIDKPRVRAMLHDETNGGVLTNLEASLMFEKAFEKAGMNGSKVDLIFSDTCLNGMIEVLEQFKGFAHCVVGSSELEPGAGWNYQRWLSMTGKAPPQRPQDWAGQAVRAYHDEYHPRPAHHPCTMGAFLTENVITARFRELVAAARANGAQGFVDLDFARAVTQSFANRDSYDMQDFARIVESRANSTGLRTAAAALQAACHAACIDFTAIGKKVSRSTGLAFWFPGSAASFDDTSSTYARLAFNRATGWTDYLKLYRSTPE